MSYPNKRQGFAAAKKAWLLPLISLFVLTAKAQTTTGKFYIYKKDGEPAADVKEAAFLLHAFPLNDTIYLSRYYNFAGPMIQQESYRDSGLTVPYGRFCWYNSEGILDSTGLVKDGKKDGNWQYIVSSMEVRSVDYGEGIKQKEQTFYYDKDGKYINQDTIGGEPKDSTQKAAVYKKGIKDWVLYCQKNLHTPERLQNLLGDGEHVSVISFLVDKEGDTRDIYLYRS